MPEAVPLGVGVCVAVTEAVSLALELIEGVLLGLDPGASVRVGDTVMVEVGLSLTVVLPVPVTEDVGVAVGEGVAEELGVLLGDWLVLPL